MKRTFVSISILILLAASLLGYADGGSLSIIWCKVKSIARVECAKRPAPERPSCCCEKKEEPATRSNCSKRTESSETTRCPVSRECKTKICRAVPPLVADGPSRTISLHQGSYIARLEAEQLLPAPVSVAAYIEPFPPWRLSSPTRKTVLRI